MARMGSEAPFDGIDTSTQIFHLSDWKNHRQRILLVDIIK